MERTWEPKLYYSGYRFSEVLKKNKTKQKTAQRNIRVLPFILSHFLLFLPLFLQQSNPYDHRGPRLSLAWLQRPFRAQMNS